MFSSHKVWVSCHEIGDEISVLSLAMMSSQHFQVVLIFGDNIRERDIINWPDINPPTNHCNKQWLAPSMVDKGTLHCRVEECSHLNLFSTSVNDSVNDIPDGTGTANSEMAGEQTEDKLQPPLLQTDLSQWRSSFGNCMSNWRTFSRIGIQRGAYCKEKDANINCYATRALLLSSIWLYI